MSKWLIHCLYSLATLAGLAGLVAGGVPLISYAWERWHNPDYGYYANLPLLSTAENTLLISFLLLILIHVSRVVCRQAENASTAKPATMHPAPPCGETSPPPLPTPSAPPTETADDKLSRLLKSQAAPPDQ